MKNSMIIKSLVILVLSISFLNSVQAQFTVSGSNLYHTGGNVGIGLSSPNALLDIKYTGSPVMNIYRATDVNNQYRWRIDQNFEMFLTNSSGTDIVEIGQDNTYFNNGNVGIGTTSPARKLDIRGGTAGSVNSRVLRIAELNNSDRYDFSLETDEYLRLNNGISDMALMAWGKNGNVGIGTTSPDNKLEVNGTIGIKGQRVMDENGTSILLGDLAGGDGQRSLILRAGDQDRLFINNSGDVGIGTNAPAYKLDVNGIIGIKGQRVLDENGSTIQFGDLAGGDGLRSLTLRAGDQDRLFITNAGNVGIGTTTPGEKLEVNGNALIDGDLYTKKVKVSVNPGNWPDYVFAKNYELRTLNEVEDFIKTNQHLPDVPSAKDVETNGLDLGDMDATLLKKVEELTLYMIEMKKEIEVLKKENQKLSEEVEKVKK